MGEMSAAIVNRSSQRSFQYLSIPLARSDYTTADQGWLGGGKIWNIAQDNLCLLGSHSLAEVFLALECQGCANLEFGGGSIRAAGKLDDFP